MQKSHTVFRIRVNDVNGLLTSGFGYTQQQAISDAKKNALFDLMQSAANTIGFREKRENGDYTLSWSEMDHCLKFIKNRYENISYQCDAYPEIYDEERGEWVSDLSKKPFTWTPKYDIKFF